MSPTSTATILDSDQLLHLLLRSIPSSQHRPHLKPAGSKNAQPTHRSPRQLSGHHALTKSANAAMQPNGDSSAPQGMLTKLGTLFIRLSRTCIKTEEEIPLLDKVKTEPEADVKKEDAEADELKEETAELTLGSNRHNISMEMDNDNDSELEIEYMIIAEKCVTTIPSTSNNFTEQRPAHSKSTKRRKKSRTSIGHTSSSTSPSKSVLLDSPPVIKRRRHVDRIPKPKRKQNKVPGFH